MGEFGVPLASDNYRAVLEWELERRRTRNPHYSMRAFARDIGIRSNRLSEILNCKQGLSPAFAHVIAPRLGLKEKELSLFLDLVTMAHGRRRAERAAAAKRIAEVQKHIRYQNIEANRFKTIHEWYHLAIVELSKLTTFQPSTKWIAAKLGITEETAEAAIAHLESAGLLEQKEGQWLFKNPDNTVGGAVSSEGVKRFHEETLKKATSAIREQSVSEREFNSMIVAIDRSRLPEIKQRIQFFLQELDRELGQSELKTDLYCLGTQFFALTENGESNA